jgi:uncharacterized protein YwgA
MDRQDLLIAALSGADSHLFTPVQIQKLLFLLEMNVSQQLGGPFFAFKPYDYGPFDPSVYEELRNLVNRGDAIEFPTGRGWSKHYLSEDGSIKGRALLSAMPSDITDYILRAAQFVSKQSFSGLVTAIYQAYPEMKVNSVFRGSER